MCRFDLQERGEGADIATSIKVFTEDGLMTDGFTRLTWSQNETTALVAHSRVVQQLDLKVGPIRFKTR